MSTKFIATKSQLSWKGMSGNTRTIAGGGEHSTEYSKHFREKLQYGNI